MSSAQVQNKKKKSGPKFARFARELANVLSYSTVTSAAALHSQITCTKVCSRSIDIC